MNSKNIKNKFIEFFKKKNHLYIPPSSIINKSDPELIFTNSGMNQFKGILLGNKNTSYKRITNSQPCLRISGKHNDLEEVGIDKYHHTLFEMLGNWSFGDYFKDYAIELAWELITNVYKLDKNKIYITVFEGNKEDNLKKDIESYNIWKKYINEENIILCPKKDNFWEMSNIGPCGPSSEIHIDIRSEEEIKKKSGKYLVNKNHPLVIEIWNLVFIEYERQKSGKLKKLLKKHVDTGLGLERISMVMQNKKSSYDTDIFKPIIEEISKFSNKEYGKNEKIDIAIRVIADHIRAISLSISDGVIPSNINSGYIIRRVIRRSIKYGYKHLEIKNPFIYKIFEKILNHLKETFKYKKIENEFVKEIIKSEEILFLKTLKNGIIKLENIKKTNKKIDGRLAFQLYDTYGFPIDLTEIIAKEMKIKIEIDEFNKLMENQKNTSKSNNTDKEWKVISKKKNSNFIGYNKFNCNSYLTEYKIKNNIYHLVFDQTPFYPEGGGQVGDTGYIKTKNKEKIRIFDTKKENNKIIHLSKKIPKTFEKKVKIIIDKKRRILISKNHTTTHILQAVLKNILGDHVKQKGSLINEKSLRFDFYHYKKINEDQINKIENLVNKKIKKNIKLKEEIKTNTEKLKNKKIKRLENKKYDKNVRIITFDKNFSVELCIGTHIKNTESIRFFKILSCNSISSNIKRIEGITSNEFENFINKKLKIINAVSKILKFPKNIKKSIKKTIEENIFLKKKIEKYKDEKNEIVKKYLESKIKKIKNVNLLIEKTKLADIKSAKNISFYFKNKYKKIFLVLFIEINKNPNIIVIVSNDIINECKKDANEIIKKLSIFIDGTGGGQKNFAISRGKNIKGVNKSIEKAIEIFKEKF